MQAHFPPFTRTDTAARAEPTDAITDREADLRTLKHYLYHAGLLVEKLIAAEASGIETVYDSGPQAGALSRDASGALFADFTRDRDATGA